MRWERERCGVRDLSFLDMLERFVGHEHDISRLSGELS